jgi:hypothetical protein
VLIARDMVDACASTQQQWREQQARPRTCAEVLQPVSPRGGTEPQPDTQTSPVRAARIAAAICAAVPPLFPRSSTSVSSMET